MREIVKDRVSYSLEIVVGNVEEDRHAEDHLIQLC